MIGWITHREKTQIFHLLFHSSGISSGCNWIRFKPGASFKTPVSLQRPTLHCFSRYISKELNQKWNSRTLAPTWDADVAKSSLTCLTPCHLHSFLDANCCSVKSCSKLVDPIYVYAWPSPPPEKKKVYFWGFSSSSSRIKYLILFSPNVSLNCMT